MFGEKKLYLRLEVILDHLHETFFRTCQVLPVLIDMNISRSYTHQGPAPTGYLFMLVGALLVGTIAFVFLVQPSLILSGISESYRGLVTQILWSLTCLGMPAWLVEFYYRKRTYRQIYNIRESRLHGRDWPYAIVLVVLGCVVAELSVALVTSYLPAPTQWLRELEESIRVQTLLVLSQNGPLSWILILLAMVVVAPVTEELLFRGAIMGWSIARTGRLHLSVWVVAILFSAIHAEWSGLIGRTILGAILGYAAVYGGMRMSILAHALNNLITVVVYKTINSPDTIENTPISLPLIVAGISAVIGIVHIIDSMRRHINRNTADIRRDNEENN